jgi:hypothetical protein
MSVLKTIIRKAGAFVGLRSDINLIEGSNVTLTVTDDPANNRVNVTINASGGSGSPGGSDTQVQFNDGGSFGGEAAFSYNKTTDTLSVPNHFTQIIKANSSAGGAIQNFSGASCMEFGLGGGQNVTFYDGVKLDAITPEAVLITDSSNNIDALVLGAGQSIRRNAGDTAYEAYTPSSSSGLSQQQIEGLI